MHPSSKDLRQNFEVQGLYHSGSAHIGEGKNRITAVEYATGLLQRRHGPQL